MKKYRIAWTEKVPLTYFIGFSISGTIWMDNGSAAVLYDSLKNAEFAYAQIRQIMVTNEKRPLVVVNMFLSIETIGGDKQKYSNPGNSDKAYDKAMKGI